MIAVTTPLCTVDGTGPRIMARKIILSAIISAGVVLIFPHLSSFLDFSVGYWHPSRLLLQGKDPYTFCDLLCLSDSIDAKSLISMNPAGMNVMYNPAVFPLFFPWALLPYRTAALLYLFFFSFSVSLVFQLLAELFLKDRSISSDSYLIFWISALPIGLLLQSVLWGSPSWMALLGVVLFFAYYGRRPFVAGVFLSLTLVKIHLFLIFGAAILACCLRLRNWLTPLGFGVAASLSLLSAIACRPDILTIYSEVVRKGQILQYVNATVPSVGRYVFNVNGPVYLLGPCVLLGVLTFVVFGFTDLSLLTKKLCCILPFSVGFAPYAWGHDYICAVPVLVVAAAYVVDGTKALSRRRVMCVCLLSLNVFALVLAVIGTTSAFLQLAYGMSLMALGTVAFPFALTRDPLYVYR